MGQTKLAITIEEGVLAQIRTLSSERIGKKIGSIDPEELAHVIEGLNEIIGG